MHFTKLKSHLITYYLNEINSIRVNGFKVGHIKFRLLMGSLPTESHIALISVLSRKKVENMCSNSEIKS